MTRSSSVSFRCARCGREYQSPVYTFIDASGEPELQAGVLSGELFLRECPDCGHRELVNAPVVYKDDNCLVCLSDRAISVDGLEGLSGRLVSNVGELIEKVKIFHAGLDDAAMEFCKFVTRSELGKDVALKFLRTEGVDNEIVFTYPEDSQMQLLAVGFNVYEDCSAIIGRNPVIGESLHGLVRVDAAWVEQFIR
ncbi:MAG: CpXC domain-containing protein [Bacteroidales bacterium]|nr:CpXC domain-containing protein [Bacteroidales bacterium]